MGRSSLAPELETPRAGCVHPQQRSLRSRCPGPLGQAQSQVPALTRGRWHGLWLPQALQEACQASPGTRTHSCFRLPRTHARGQGQPGGFQLNPYLDSTPLHMCGLCPGHTLLLFGLCSYKGWHVCNWPRAAPSSGCCPSVSPRENNAGEDHGAGRHVSH